MKRTNAQLLGDNRKLIKALKSVQESFKLLFSEADNPLPQGSIAMGVVKGFFIGVPQEVNKALASRASITEGK